MAAVMAASQLAASSASFVCVRQGSLQSASRVVAFTGPSKRTVARFPVPARLVPSKQTSKRASRIVPMAVEDVEEVQSEINSAVSGTIKEIQEAWEKTDDKLAISALGAAGIIVLWASIGLVGAIDKLPLIPGFFELVGILFSGWFTYRYLLFKPDREELFKIIDDAKSKITGQ